MKVLMMTNTYAPHVGGVARSIERFARSYRARGHHVRIVAPEFDGVAADEADVVRVPAVRHFNHTDFSLALPIPHRLRRAVEEFEPDVVHSHHPFLVGGTALRVAHAHDLPIVFTHHTRYEDYTHNVPLDSPMLKRFVERLATNYANLCDRVFVPSESIRDVIARRGVTTPISVVPTGIDAEAFAEGDGAAVRRTLGIPPGAFVVGHLGRLTAEKNLPFLVDAILRFVRSAPTALDVHCAVFGSGPLANELTRRFAAAGLDARLHLGGRVVGEQAIANAYHAMDVFAFASLTETQGMVLTEAMACGVPVVAIDAPGVREVLDDGVNGRLLPSADADAFADALASIAALDGPGRRRLSSGAHRTAERFSMARIADEALELYARLRRHDTAHRASDYPAWVDALHVVRGEWELLGNTVRSAAEALPSATD